MFSNFIAFILVGVVSIFFSRIISLAFEWPLIIVFGILFTVTDMLFYLIPAVILSRSGFDRRIPKEERIEYQERASGLVFNICIKVFFTAIIALILPEGTKWISYSYAALVTTIIAIFGNYLKKK